MRIFSGRFKNRIIQVPKGLKTRPTTGRLRAALFNICRGFSGEAHFLDLFAGSGAMGFEALSQGAQAVTFVDNSKESVQCIKSNIKLLQVEDQATVIYADVFDAMALLAKKGQLYDIIYADPPYEMAGRSSLAETYSMRVLSLLEQLLETETPLLAPAGSLFLEDAIEGMPEKMEWKHLELQSERKAGRSALQHYIRRE